MSGAREAILASVRGIVQGASATPDADYATVTRDYRRISGLSRAERVDLFASRIVHYDGSVLRCIEPALPETIARTLSARTKRGLHVPADIDPAWLPSGWTFTPDRGASADELDQSEGVLTGCSSAIALTGTIVLTHGRGEGRRALTLVPDYHLAIVFDDQVVETVPEGLQRAAERLPALITTISGPSATADIEMTRIKGVHGPRTLDVILVTTAR